MDPGAPPGLAELIARLTGLPPNISALIMQAQNTLDIEWFRQMVARLLPDEAAEITSHQDPGEMIADFAMAFEDHYFPLNALYIQWLEEWDYSEQEDGSAFTVLAQGPPYAVFGFEDHTLDYLWDEHEPLLPMLLLLMHEDEFARAFFLESEGLRMAWFDRALDHVDQTELSRIPENGWRTERIIAALQAAGLDDAATTFRWLTHQTGAWMADTYLFEETVLTDIYDDGWDDEALSLITDLWHEAKPIVEATDRTRSWIYNDPTAAFATLIDAIEQFHTTDNQVEAA